MVFFLWASTELQAFAHHGRSLPRFQVTLCFGEEFPDPQRQRKLITAHVSPQLHSHHSGFLFFVKGRVSFRKVPNEK